MCSIDIINKWSKCHQLPFFVIGLFIVILLFLSSLFCHTGFANNPVNLRLVGQWNNTYGIFKDIEILEIDDIGGNGGTGMKYAFCVTALGMVIFDINDINEPYMISFTPIPGCNDIEVKESASDDGDIYAYVAANVGGQGRLEIFNVTDPKYVFSTCQQKTPGNAIGVTIVAEDGYAYVADGQKGLTIFNISDNTAPQHVGDFPGLAQKVVIEDDYAYVAGNILKILDISNRTSPTIAGITGAHIFKGGECSLTIAGDYAYAAYWMRDSEDVWDKDLKIIDISNKECPTIIGRDPNLAGDMVIEGNYMYAYVAGNDSGLKIFDISNRRFPIEVGSSDISHDAGRVAVKGNYAYVLDQHLRIFDISDKSDLNMVGTGNVMPGTPKDMVIAGKYAYVADGKTGLLIIDIGNQNGPACSGIYQPDPPGFVVQGVAVEGDNAYVISRMGDPNADRQSSLQVIDVSDKGDPNMVEGGDLDIDGAPIDIAIEGGYAYVTFLKEGSIEEIPNSEIIIDCSNIAQNNGFDFIIGLRIIDIQDPGNPKGVGTVILERIGGPGINMIGGHVAIEGDYAYVISRMSDPNPCHESSLRIIDISDKSDPHCIPNNIDGDTNIPGFEVDFALVSDYAYVIFIEIASDPNNPNCSNLIQDNESVCKRILQIIDIRNPESPEIVSHKILDSIKCVDASDDRASIAISDEYAYIAGLNTPLQIIDLSNPVDPNHEIDYSIIPMKALQNVHNVAIADDYMYLTGKSNILWKLKIDIGKSPKGNLILVAGGNTDYESSYWHATQSLANQIFKRFIDNGYETYEIYYHNPVSVQDIDNDGIPNQMVVDYPSPSSETLKESFIRCSDQNTNTGPLYIYLIGHGGEDRFQIMPGQVIDVNDLKEYIDIFQNGYTDDEGKDHPGTNRQVVVIIESADSGTFMDDLIDDNVTVITSTGEGASYIKPDFSDSNAHYNSFTSALIESNAFIDAIIPSLDPNDPQNDIPGIINNFLKHAFITARDQLESWAIEGPPFANQAPQMALPGNIYTAFYFSVYGEKPVSHLLIDQNSPYYLTIIGRDPNNNGLDPNTRFIPIDSQNFRFFSSDQDILDTDEIGETEIDGMRWHEIIPKRNGRVILKGYADPEKDPDLLLSAKLIIEVSVKDPNFLAVKGKMAVIMAGYSGSGDYLWESTNEIGKHAYQILRKMGYTKREIYYYNPYFLQDLDNNGRYDDIKGYPHMKVLDPNTPDSPFAEIGMTGAKELLLFFVDHGSQDEFNLNPNETFSDTNLVNLLDEVGNQVDEKIIFLYDACYSGSFLSGIKEAGLYESESLADKLITITSADFDQTAYFLNQGMISFSYPFFDEWLLTHSLTDAFDYAGRFLLGGQTPQIFDPNLAEEWDRDTVYYSDESRPVIDNVQAYRSSGDLHIEADVYALTGINEVRAIIVGAKEPVTTSLGRAITNALQLDLDPVDQKHPDSDYGGKYMLTIPDPCPNETSYIIFIYATDRSEPRPRIAKYKINLGDMTESRTIALIIASDPNILSYPDISSNPNMSHEEIQNELSDRITRARDILKNKGLSQENPKEIFTVMSRAELDDLRGTGGIFPLAQGQTLFIYLTGYTQLQNGSAYFYLNPIEGLTTEEFFDYIQQDANQRLLILMDTPYSVQFLESAIAPDKWPERWAGIAGTDQGDLFFIIDPNDERPFPCFSNFFFSGLLSGATVAEAYRLAEMAVSLTRQGPEIFLPEQDIEGYETINRYLGYYLGASAVPGEEEPLLIHCRALAKEENGQTHYLLSLTPHPDANIINARAVLTSPTSTLFKKSMTVDLDQNDHIYTADKESGINYYKALFMVEGRINGDDAGKNRTDWQEVPIASSEPITITENDGFEPDNDPNFILLYAKNEIIVNTLPVRHRFYNEYTDWAYFYALKDHIYEISVQDLSIYDYFIRIKLYDPNMNPINGEGDDKNFLIFMCEESGYYRLEVTLGATYPDKGVGYILSVIDPRAGKYTSLLLEIFNPRVEIIDPQTENLIPMRSPITVICEDSETHINYSFGNEQFIYPDSFCYKLNYLPEGIDLEIKVYQGDDYPDDPNNYIKNVVIETGPTKYLYIDLTNLIDTNKITIPDEYWDDANYYRDYGIVSDKYPWDANNPIPFGDMDTNFPPEGDFDGDGLSNHDEIIFYKSDATFPTIPLYLSSGMNIFYFPSVINEPNVKKVEHYIYDPNNDSGARAIYKDSNQEEISYYYYETNTEDTDQGQWCLDADEHLSPNQFNAIYTKRGGILYLDMKSIDHPVLCLRGFLDSNRFKIDDPAFWLDPEMINPYDFDTNVLISEILKDPDLWEIESITSEHFERDIVGRDLKTGSWETSYRFFGRPSISGRFSEKDMRIMPSRTYFIHRNKERIP